MRPLLAALGALLACAVAGGQAAADGVRDNEWALGALQVPQAWSITKGQGVTVAVLDTGVDPNHTDLAGQVTSGPDLVGGPARLGDPYWGFHGTAMASDIAGHGHGPGGGDGVIGVAPAAKILSVRVIWDRDDPIRRLSESQRAAAGAQSGDPIARGIRYAVDHGAQVVNMSLGETATAATRSAETDSAVQYAIAHGVVLVASEGNSAETTNLTEFPAAYPGVIAVAASDRVGHRASFSTHEWTTSVAAPGVGVVGAHVGSGYIVGDGTSPAAALVSGVAALLMARYPRLTPAQVRLVLERTATGAGSYNEDLGWGVVQAAAALRMAGSIAPEPATPQPVGARSRTFAGDPPPVVGLAALDVRMAVTALALLLAGSTALLAAVLLAALRGRARE
ncbi:MAG TPA: S8 family serine peptidase [Candidatus Dormibacteraeota bacterium]